MSILGMSRVLSRWGPLSLRMRAPMTSFFPCLVALFLTQVILSGSTIAIGQVVGPCGSEAVAVALDTVDDVFGSKCASRQAHFSNCGFLHDRQREVCRAFAAPETWKAGALGTAQELPAP